MFHQPYCNENCVTRIPSGNEIQIEFSKFILLPCTLQPCQDNCRKQFASWCEKGRRQLQPEKSNHILVNCIKSATYTWTKCLHLKQSSNRSNLCAVKKKKCWESHVIPRVKHVPGPFGNARCPRRLCSLADDYVEYYLRGWFIPVSQCSSHFLLHYACALNGPPGPPPWLQAQSQSQNPPRLMELSSKQN